MFKAFILACIIFISISGMIVCSQNINSPSDSGKIYSKQNKSQTNHQPILIKDNSTLFQLATQDSWVGNGTKENPFIIANYVFDYFSNMSNCAINISDVPFYFIVDSNMISSAGYDTGIAISNVSNIIIRDNIIQYTYQTAIRIIDSPSLIQNNSLMYNYGKSIVLLSCSNSNIITNTILNNQEAYITVNNSNNLVIETNVISSSFFSNEEGIFIENGNNITFKGNFLELIYFQLINIQMSLVNSSNVSFSNNIVNRATLTFNSLSDFNFSSNILEMTVFNLLSSNYDYIFNNTFQNSPLFVNDIESATISQNYFDQSHQTSTLLYLQSTNLSVIQNNYFSSNHKSLVFESSFNNTIKFNYFVNSSWVLTFYLNSSYNVFYGNNFNDISILIDFGQNLNIWDNGTLGNYWSNHCLTDLNNDSICDYKFDVTQLSYLTLSFHEYDYFALTNEPFIPNLTKLFYDNIIFNSILQDMTTATVSTSTYNTNSITSSSSTSTSIATSNDLFGIFVIVLAFVIGSILVINSRKNRTFQTRNYPLSTRNYNNREQVPVQKEEIAFSKSKKYCYNCSTEAFVDDIFCSNCGSRLT